MNDDTVVWICCMIMAVVCCVWCAICLFQREAFSALMAVVLAFVFLLNANLARNRRFEE